MTEDEYDARWQCRWCRTYTHPVGSIVADHEARCIARPSEVDD